MTGIEITADLVRDLLREQHPDLAGLAIREVAGGWDRTETGAFPAASLTGDLQAGRHLTVS